MAGRPEGGVGNSLLTPLRLRGTSLPTLGEGKRRHTAAMAPTAQIPSVAVMQHVLAGVAIPG